MCKAHITILDTLFVPFCRACLGYDLAASTRKPDKDTGTLLNNTCQNTCMLEHKNPATLPCHLSHFPQPPLSAPHRFPLLLPCWPLLLVRLPLQL